MGQYQSISDAEEIPVYIQEGAHSFSFLYLMPESAKFEKPKPCTIQVTDDTWASLRLRVDPPARVILEPHRLYRGACILCILLGVALATVRPDFEIAEDIDDDLNISYNAGYYYANDDDAVVGADDFWQASDVNYNEWKYRNRAVRREKLAWNLSFGLLFAFVIGATGVLAWMMVSRNKGVDNYIRKVCDELSNQFEKEGYAIRYKTRTQVKGAFLGHIFPERAICFRELTVEQLSERWSKEVYIPPDPHV